MVAPLLTCATNYTAVFGQLLEEGLFVDCTLAAEGRYLKAHKAVLSAASVYFELLFTQENESDPVIIFTNIRFKELEAVMKFMYHGGVEIFEDGLEEFLNAATFLQIRGVDYNKLMVSQRNAPSCGPDVSPRDTWEESSQIMPAIDCGSIKSSMRRCDENVCKTELPDSECSDSCSSVQPAFEYEFSTLVTDIEIKEQDEEIYSEVKMETDGMTARMEYVNGDGDKEVSCGQHDGRIGIEDTVMQCESAVIHVGNEETIKCPSCDFETTEETVYNEHKRHFLEMMPSQLPLCTSSSMQSSATNNGEFQNRKGKPLKCRGTTALEMQAASMYCKENPFKYTECTYPSSKANLIRPMRKHTGGKPFNCSQCTYTGMRKAHLTRHMRSHTGEKPFKCAQCGLAFSDKSNLISHIRTHTGEKPFKCSQCAYTCIRKTQLTVHMRSHTGEKPFKCSQCFFACSEKCNLIKHVLTHTGEKPFKCSQCFSAFSVKYSLIKHMRRHTGEKPFKCPQCFCAFSVKYSLIKHMRTHTGEKPFKCAQCSFACCDKSNLISHIRTHTGEKPFKCSQCTYTCIRKSHLTLHMQSHTGKKPFMCSQCTYTYSSKQKLIIHMRTHTGE